MSTGTLTTDEVEELLKSNSHLTRYLMAREVHLLICALVIAHKSDYADFFAQVEICKAYLGRYLHVDDEESWMALGNSLLPKVNPKQTGCMDGEVGA